jgi:hypothetical protein
MVLKSVLFGITVATSAVLSFIVLRAIINHLVLPLVELSFGFACAVANLTAESFEDMFRRNQNFWSSKRARTKQEKRVREILRRAHGKSHSGVDQKLVERTQNEQRANATLSLYRSAVKICLSAHHETAKMYFEAYPWLQELPDVLDDTHLEELRENVAANAEALHEIIRAGGLATLEVEYATSLIRLRFVQEHCGPNCPFWNISKDNIPHTCGPAQFVKSGENNE